MVLRRLLEARLGKPGKREFVQVLRLLEVFDLEVVAAGVREAIDRGAIGFVRWSPWLGQFGGLAKLGSDCCQAANVSVPVAQYASLGVRPASVECGRRAL